MSAGLTRPPAFLSSGGGNTVVVPLPSSDPPIPGPDGLLVEPQPDGAVIISVDSGSSKTELGEEEFDANLAPILDETELSRIAEDLLRAIEEDIQARSEWMQIRDRGIDLLGLKLEEASAQPVGGGAIPGIAKITNPLLIQGVINTQAMMRGELLPAEGPCKVKVDGEKTDKAMAEADDLEEAINSYLTVGAPEYYPDTDRGLFRVGLEGCVFKKVYHCPLRDRPVSDCVYASDLVVSPDASSTHNARRITHVFNYRTSQVKRLQNMGFYDPDVELGQPQPPNTTDPGQNLKAKEIEGIQTPVRPEDLDHLIYESYTELDIGEHEDDEGNQTGIALPYVVTIEKDSRKILAIRRFWKEDDERQLARRRFVMYPYVFGLGFYPIGLSHIVGNATRALTSIDREAIDAGMFANFPGLIIGGAISKQRTNQIIVPPGGAFPIDTGEQPVGNVIMPLPYKDVTAGLLELRKMLMEEGKQLVNAADIQVGEGRADVPVGTVIALIEQATKTMSEVHKRLHAAQAEEFQLLRDLFVDDPEPLTRHLKNKERSWLLEGALANYSIVPAADPNVPSRMHRVMRGVALVQLYQSAPQLYDGKKVHLRALNIIGIDDPEELFASAQMPMVPPPPPPDPVKLLEVQQRGKASDQKHQIEAGKLVLAKEKQDTDVATANADRATDASTAEMKEAGNLQATEMQTEAQKENAQLQAKTAVKTAAKRQAGLGGKPPAAKAKAKPAKKDK